MTEAKKIYARIDEADPGAIFIPSDFFDLASPDNTNNILSRLAKQGIIERVLRGIYAKPKHSALLDKNVPPDPNDVAHAIARTNGWSIAPAGDTALNTLGLDTQVPAVHSYISSGPYKNYRYGPFDIVFKRVANRDIVNRTEKTSTIIQALKSLGRAGITDRIVQKLASALSDDDVTTVLDETQNATSWIYETMKQVKEARRCIK